jgi:hypothetical protein
LVNSEYMISVEWKSAIETENFLIPSSNFEPKSQGLLQSFWIHVNADHLSKVTWKVQPAASRSRIAAFEISIIQRIPISFAEFRNIESERWDRISKRKAEFSLSAWIYGQRVMLIHIYELDLGVLVQ